MTRRRTTRRKSSPLLGLWIGLGVAGGLILIVSIVLVVSLVSDQSASPNETANNSSNASTLFGGVVDDGSPVLISNPQFLKDRHGQSILRVNYELKRPNEIPAGSPLTMWLKGGTKGGYGGHFEAPRQFSKSDLQQTGTFDLPLYNFLKMPTQLGVRLPDCDVHWESGSGRISNVLSVRLPTNPDSLPVAPEIVQFTAEARQLEVQLFNASYDGGFIPKMFVNLSLKRGTPNPQFQYVLVCEQKVLAGSFSHDQKLDQDFLTRGGQIEVKSLAGFHSNSTYDLRVEAYLPSQRQTATVVSNIVHMPGPSR
ncbi:MAG: hypothetical protein KDA84_15925 [Planctomycetaceae bacterium]|nr:hypothetical protein [Planctomycetaceae bacterium]